MKCPFCSHNDTQVVETRLAEDGDLIRRRRQCAACEKKIYHLRAARSYFSGHRQKRWSPH